MNFGFHYHIPAVLKNNRIHTMGFIGVFIDSLAAEVSELHCFLHTPTRDEENQFDYVICSSNVKFHSLGIHNSVVKRWLSQWFLLRKYSNELAALDVILIRIPTPILKSFYSFLPHKKVVLLKVGDYVEGSKILDFPLWRRKLIQAWAYLYNLHEVAAIKKSIVFTNSAQLKVQLEKIKEDIGIIRTTTLSSNSFFARKDTCNKDKIKLLYTGRMDLGKGLAEMIEALCYVRSQGVNSEMHFVGWEENGSVAITEKLQLLAKYLKVDEFVFFHGRMKMGAELDSMYRSCDIYLMGSKVIEGFPRTIWEAMANSLPVVATKVGSIPFFLNSNENALLIEPNNSKAMAQSIIRLASDQDLRTHLIANAFILAQANTLESQAKKLVYSIRSKIQS